MKPTLSACATLGTFSADSVKSTWNGRSAVDWRFWSSVADTRQCQVPSTSNAVQAKRYVPGWRGPESIGRVEPSGATSSAVTVEGRTTV